MLGPDGKLLAKFLPFGANNGVVDAKGQIHVDARMSFQWVDDQTYGYLVAIGPSPNLYM